MTRIVVTGLGVITAIGKGVAESLSDLRAGHSGIGKAKFLDSKYTDTIPLGEVDFSKAGLFDELGLKSGSGLARTDLLALVAFREACASANLSEKEIASMDTAFLSASTVGGMTETEAIHGDTNTHTEPSEFIYSYRSGAHTLQVVNIHGLKGYTDTVNTACSSSANSIMTGARILVAGRAKRVIAGGVDGLSRYTVNGFNALQILSDAPTRPFDADRNGLNLGEGAAYLVLEREEDLNGRMAYGLLSGYGNANDAYHPSAMDPEATGVRGAINSALKSAGLSPEKIDLINAHGTGTENNDQVELAGLTMIFENVPPFVSTKSYTGHTLAAAGAVESVFSLLNLLHQEIHPSLNFETAMPGFSHTPHTEFSKGLGSTTCFPILSGSVVIVAHSFIQNTEVCTFWTPPAYRHKTPTKGNSSVLTSCTTRAIR